MYVGHEDSGMWERWGDASLLMGGHHRDHISGTLEVSLAPPGTVHAHSQCPSGNHEIANSFKQSRDLLVTALI